jgi:hypothetical protein
MTTTPHDGTKYHDPSWSSPAETAADQQAYVEDVRDGYAGSFDSTVEQFALLADVPPPGSNYALPTDWLNKAAVTDWVDEDVPGDGERAAYALKKYQTAGGVDGVFIALLIDIRDTPTTARASAPQDDPSPTINATIAQLMEWVGDDPDRALSVLDAESAKDEPRTTLISQLENLITPPE